jgi:deoxyribonuclease-4
MNDMASSVGKRNPKVRASDAAPLLGVHVSTAGGVITAFDRAEKLGINTFQLFVKNNKQWFAKDFEDGEAEAFRKRRSAWKGKGPLVAHACYLLNIGSSDPAINERSRESFKKELERANLLGIEYFVFHPGSHTGTGEESAIQNIAAALDAIHRETEGYATKSVLEVTAGQGSAVGYKFEHLEQILEKVRDKNRVGVCLDTCHMFAAGYDIRSVESWETTWAEFGARIGFDRLVCIHTNDSKKGLRSRVDRHEHIGEGEIGIEAFRLLMNDPRLAGIPKILETPKDDEMTEDFVNLAKLKSLIG